MGHAQHSIKSQAIDLIKNLPDQCSLEDIQYHLYVYEKVQRGLKTIEEGPLFSQEEAEKKVAEWLKLSGQGRH